MMSWRKHPEFDKRFILGGFDTELYVGFRQELNIRNIMRKELNTDLDLYIKDDRIEVNYHFKVYHEDVKKELESLKSKKYINEFYEVIK